MVNMQLVTSDSKLRVRIEAETLGPLIVAWIRPALDAMFKLSRWCGIAGGWRVATDRILLFVFGQSCKYNTQSRNCGILEGI